ncbi:MAG TPA: cysteine hydrolase [Chloroflexota bacterium]|nr:cysteine hydrolase [Chloroflexota bacterium]
MQDRLDPQRTALLVIDMQRGAFTAGDERARLLAASGIAERLAELVRTARARGVLIVYVLNTRRADGRDQVRLPIQDGLAPLGRPVEGTPEWEVIDALRPAPEDYRVIKRRRNAFYGTDLDLLLRARGITTLVVGGQRTTVGVESTVRDAFDRDYAVIVLRDGCGGVPADEQEWAMQRVFPTMARVMTCAEGAALLG